MSNTREIPLVENEYREVSDKEYFLAKLEQGYAQIYASDTKPENNAVGISVDPSKPITRQFDGTLWAKATTDKALMIVMESDA
jgi:hypothetical protein